MSLGGIPSRTIQTARDRALSPLAKASAANLRLLHPDWDHRFFDDGDIRAFVRAEFPRYQSVFESFRYPIQRIDFFRYLAVYRLGGFYFDLDVMLHRPLAGLLECAAVFPFEELTLSGHLRSLGVDWEIGNYAFGAASGSPFLEAVIENCVRAQRDPAWAGALLRGLPRLLRPDFEVLATTGPGLLTRTLAENPRLAEQVTILFPDDVCDRRNWDLFGDFGIHLMSGSWRAPRSAWRRRLAAACEARLQSRALAESRTAGPRRTLAHA